MLMRAGDLLLLAVCEGGGNDTLAKLVVLVIAALYLLVVMAALGGAEGAGERVLLILLFAISVSVGAAAYGNFGGISGLGDFIARMVISLIISGGIALLGAATLREESAGRAVFVAVAGNILVPAGIFVFFFASMGIGTGCLN
ncbi:MAG TPA: hypothetical protein VFJ61_00575 [Solirubrobacterales bacterium]|nr:hypothetical protein [Solirubrobacterales bacterium]